jgi:endonuclease-3
MPACPSKTSRVHQLLLEAYGQPSLKEQRDPLSELVLTILSQNTADINTARAYAALRQRFATWEQVLAAPTAEVADAIRIGGLADIKAPRIQRILQQLHTERGALDLGFLADLPLEEARSYLTGLHGVGPKTAACVLLFALRRPALPVDTHVHRVSLRVGLVPPKTSADKAHLLLEAQLAPEEYYPFHLNVIRHGREVCKAQRPQCDACALNAVCDYYAAKPEA